MINQNPSSITSWRVLQIVYESILKNIDVHFQKMAVNYMPIKGSFLILSGLSSKFSSRRMRDIDILVSKEDYPKVVHYFDALEETESVNGYWEFEQPFVYHCNNQNVYLEIHYLVNAPARFLLSTQDLFFRGVAQNPHCIFPHPVDAMLIHVCHQLLHIYNRFEISFFDEIAVLEDQDGYLWEEFWKGAEKTGIKPFIWLMIKMYSERTGRETKAPHWSTWYTSLLDRFSFEWFSKLDPIYRKILLEIPFVRNPYWLAKYKVLKMLKNTI